MPLSILIVTSIHPDFDQRIWKQSRLLASEGAHVELVCPWSVADGEIVDGVRLLPFRRFQSRLARIVFGPFRVMRHVLKHARRAQVVHFHDLDLLPLMTFLSLFKPVVFDVHENYPDEMLVKAWLPRPLRRSLYWLVRIVQFVCSRIIGNVVLVAPSQERYFSSAALTKTYLFNYASEALHEGRADDYSSRDDLVIFTGAHHVENGSLLLLDIVERCKECMPQLRFLTVDRFFDARFREELLSRIRARKLEEHISVIPQVRPHQLMTLLNRATIAISPNLRVPQQIHGIHTKLFEYMAAGLPIVASDLPHQLEVVAEGKCGLVAAPEDVDSFVRAIRVLVEDRDYAKSLGENGIRQFRRKFAYESQAGKLLEYYRFVLVGR